MPSLATVIALLLKYRYFLLFPLAIIEGPILIIIGGFLASLNIMNPFFVYAIVVAGDIVGDTFLYSLGRWGSELLRKWGPKIGATNERLIKTKEFFDIHHGKAVSLSKLFHGVGFTGLIVAGILKLPYGRYFRTCLWITFVQSAVLLLVGILFGHAYVQIGGYLNFYAAGISVIVASFILVFALYKFKISSPR